MSLLEPWPGRPEDWEPEHVERLLRALSKHSFPVPIDEEHHAELQRVVMPSLPDWPQFRALLLRSQYPEFANGDLSA